MITLLAPRGMDSDASAWLSVGLSPSGLGRFLHSAQRAACLQGEVHVLLADDVTLRRLNRTFLGKDRATDVLSFPAAAELNHSAGVAGDLAISLETAARQAKRFGHTLRDEVRVLLLHGTLHLAGFDHESDDGEMASREEELRRALKLPSSVIVRASSPASKPARKRVRP